MTTESRTTSTPETAAATRACGCLTRRHALAGAVTVGVGVPFLAACGADDGSGPEEATSGAGQTGTPAPSGGGSAEGGLTTAGDIPVGGGTIFPDDGVVITQPSEGEFKAFTNICTHQGCPVTSVEDGVILCSCHRSTFSIEDGSPQGGPATSALAEIDLSVDGDSISLA